MRCVSFLILVNLRRVDVNMNDLAVLGKFFKLARNAIVKPDTEREKQIRLIDSIVCIDSSMHAQHVQRLRMSARKNAKSHHRHGHRDASPQGKLCQFF